MNGRLIAGRYELTTLIGQGGMGQVWTAQDRRLDRPVAVKLLRSGLLTDTTAPGELRRRFARECRITAQVDHPGLVTVHDAGTEDDDLYLVMQYVRGADLADHLAEHSPYPWTWAVAVVAQLCPALAAMHAVPVVHRDLKPRNIVVRQDGGVVVLDLGIAAALDTDTTRLTLTGSPIGSPAYMAPEQALGGAVGPRTDLYSLGVILHELLGGAVPFEGGSALGILHRHLHEPPVPLRRVRPDTPESLEALVLRLLAKDPQDRPADAAEVYRALLPLLPGPAGADAGPAAPMDPTRPLRHPFIPWQQPAAPAPALPAPTVLAQAVPAPALPTPATPPPSVPDLVEAGSGAATPYSGVPVARRDVVGPAVEEAKRLLDAGLVTQAVGVLGGALPAAAEAHGPHSPVVRILRKQYAATLMENGQYTVALPQLKLLAEQHAADAGPADPQALRFRYEAAQCLEHLGETGAALAEYRALLPGLDVRADTDPALPLDVRRRMGHLLLAAGDRAGARAVLLRVAHDAQARYGPHHPLAAEAHRMLEWLRQVG